MWLAVGGAMPPDSCSKAPPPLVTSIVPSITTAQPLDPRPPVALSYAVALLQSAKGLRAQTLAVQ